MTLELYTHSDISKLINFSPTKIILLTKENILSILKELNPKIIDDAILQIKIDENSFDIVELPFVIKTICNEKKIIQGKDVFNLKDVSLLEHSLDTNFKRSLNLKCLVCNSLYDGVECEVCKKNLSKENQKKTNIVPIKTKNEKQKILSKN